MGGVVDRRAGVADVPNPAQVAVAFELVVVQPLRLERACRTEPTRASTDDADRIAAVERERLGRRRRLHGVAMSEPG